ncbi:hypothetical protein RYH73_03410 [Olivibacter sp. CPCC 100613]|uniref:hypothetical protein n=1 Tax=Olivibacter sp. CPCC 100613 TaxID=3079931 RepID=UPI002FF4B50A
MRDRETVMLKQYLRGLKHKIKMDEADFNQGKDKEAIELLKATIDLIIDGRINEVKRIINLTRW